MKLSAIEGRLRSDFTQVLLGNMLYYACQWSIMIALAKLGTPQQLGEYALGMAIAAPILLFANLQLRAIIASDVQDQFTLAQFFTFRLATMILALLVIVGAAAVGSGSNWRRSAVILAVAIAQIVDCFAETYYAWMQKYGRLDRMARSLWMKGPLALGALCVAMYVTRNVLWAVLGLVVGRLAILLVWDTRLGFTGDQPPFRLDWSFLRLRRHRPLLRSLLRLALPLGLISMLGSLSANIPRYFVEAHLGSAELGIFSAIASLLSTGTLVISAFGQSIFVPVAQACARADRSVFRTFLIASTAVGAALGVAGVAGAAVLGRRTWAAAGFRRPIGRFGGSVRTRRTAALGLGQLRRVPRWVHACRRRQLRAEAQRDQWRGKPGRLGGELVAQLGHRGADTRPAHQRRPRPCPARHAGLRVLRRGHAHAAGRR